MESTVARLLDKVALLGDVGGYVCFTVMATAALGRRRLGVAARRRSSGGVEWMREGARRLQARLEDSGPSTASRRWRGGRRRRCMQSTEQLRGVGRKTPRWEVGWAGWAVA